jgi:ribosomal protein L11 methyltransferase
MWRVRVPVTYESEEAVTCLMERTLGTTASVYTDANTGRSWVNAYLANSAQWDPAKRAELTRGLHSIAHLGLAIPRIHVAVSRVATQDWAESWKKHFKPLEIRRRLLILPSWSRRRPAKNQAVVVLDPGLSFGTGQHPTTRFCLEQLVDARNRQNANSLLDMGCGSGILAIAAATIGYQQVEAFDFDPVAVRAAAQNAKKNRVQKAIKFVRRDLRRMPETANRAFEVVCANLTADLLVSEAKKIRNRLAQGGRLVVAGILRLQFAEVHQAFEKHRLALVRTKAQGEWRSGVFRIR